MKDFLLKFYNDKIIIILYAIILTALAINKFRKNTKERPIFTCENLFILFYYVFIAVAPIYNVWVNNYKYTYNIFFIFFICLVLFVIGADLIVGNKYLKNEKRIKELSLGKVEGKFVVRSATLFLIIGYFFLCCYLIQNLNIIMQDVENNRVIAMQGSGIIMHLGYMILPATWILYYYHLNYKNNKLIYVYIILDIILLLLMGFRSRVLELILLLIIIRNDFKPFKMRRLITIGVILIASIIIMQLFRTFISGGSADIGIDSLISAMGVSGINSNYIFDSFPDKVPFQYGYTYWLSIKMLLPGPDIDATLWLKNVLNLQYDGGGLTPSIIGELFINFGYIGIFIGMLILGIVCRLIDNYAKNKKINRCIYYILLLYIPRMVGSGISTFFILTVWFLIVTFIILKLKIKGKNE